MQTVLCILGTRPEAIKMAPVIEALRRRSDYFRVIVGSTGQHRQMLDQVLELFSIKPDFDLNLMQPNQTLAGLTAKLMVELDRQLEQHKPDWVLAQGDTTTAMVAGLAAFYRGVRFGHVEAGLRTGDRRHPFPEEINRRIADLVADLYFAPTQRSRAALLAEGVPDRMIQVTGNTVIDALLEIAGRSYDWAAGPLANLPRDRRLVLVTAHRRESFGQPFEELCLAIRELAERFASAGVHMVYPVHLNPNVREPVNRLLSGLGNVSLIEPLDYLDLVHLMKRSELILTDSGGIQEEAPSLGVPVLVMRQTTERPEGVEAGVVKLVGTERREIVEQAARLLTDPQARAAMTRQANPYGDGQASMRIIQSLLNPSADHQNHL